MRTLLLFFAITCYSCATTELSGKYVLRQFPKTSFEFRNDGTFEFHQMYSNPYLHPFDHPNENFFTTTGAWEKTGLKVVINSNRDSMISKAAEIVSMIDLQTPVDTVVNLDGKREALRYSRFTFYDIYNDTVNVLYAKSPDGNSMSLLHRSMKVVDWPLSGNDTIEFHFFGYSPFAYVRPDNERRAISVRLFP